MRRNWLSAVIVVGVAGPVFAQAVTVQQPVICSMGVNTTVSVPDRGSALLGGVNSAATGRTVNGPFPSGTASGREAQGSSMRASVYIHDLRAMDEALLASAPSAAPGNDWEQKLAVRRGETAPSVKRPVTSRSAEYEALAKRAEERGKTSLAMTYWRLAAKEGSAVARTKLAETPTAAATASR